MLCRQSSVCETSIGAQADRGTEQDNQPQQFTPIPDRQEPKDEPITLRNLKQDHSSPVPLQPSGLLS